MSHHSYQFMPSAHLGSYGLAASKPDDGLWYPVVKECHNKADIFIIIYDAPQVNEADAFVIACQLAYSSGKTCEATLTSILIDIKERK